MNCEEIKKELYDYILGELDPSVEIRVNDHVATCTDCRKELEQGETFVNTVRKSRKLKPGPAVYEKILHAKALATRSRTRTPWKVRVGLVSAIASFFLGIVFMYGLDVFILNKRLEAKGTEVRSEPLRRTPFSDTVKFYYAPSKNLAQI